MFERAECVGYKAFPPFGEMQPLSEVQHLENVVSVKTACALEYIQHGLNHSLLVKLGHLW